MMKSLWGWGLMFLTLWSNPSHAGDVAFSGWASFTLDVDHSSDWIANFDQAQLYLISNANINSSWSLFSEVEFEHVPSFEAEDAAFNGAIKLERTYIQYSRGAGHLRFGRILTPFGIRVPLYWQILTPMISKPPIQSMDHIKTHVTGIEAHTELDFQDVAINLTAVVHNGPEDRGGAEVMDGLTGTVGDINLTYRSQYRIGSSIFHSREDGSLSTTEFSAVGYVDVPLPWNVLLRTESVYFSKSDSHHQHQTHYVLATYTLHPYPMLTAGYRWGFGILEMQQHTNGNLHTANLSWSPSPGIRFVVEHERQYLPNQSPKSCSIAWLGASF